MACGRAEGGRVGLGGRAPSQAQLRLYPPPQFCFASSFALRLRAVARSLRPFNQGCGAFLFPTIPGPPAPMRLRPKDFWDPQRSPLPVPMTSSRPSGACSKGEPKQASRKSQGESWPRSPEPTSALTSHTRHRGARPCSLLGNEVPRLLWPHRLPGKRSPYSPRPRQVEKDKLVKTAVAYGRSSLAAPVRVG